MCKRRKITARILLIILVLALATISCVGPGDGENSNSSSSAQATLNAANITATFGAKEFHTQLTAIAEQEK